MSALVLATQRTAQPQGSAPIDWGNPLTRGLSFALSGVDGRDRVRGGAITRTASLSTGVTRHGFGFLSAANSAFSRALDLSGTSEITVSFVLVLRASTTAVLVEHTPTYNTNAGSFLIYTDAGSFFAGVSNGAGGAGGFNVAQCTAPALNTPVRVVVTLRRIGTTAKACRVWFEGVEQATTQPFNGAISGNFANSTTYFLGRGASSLFANAIIQDPAIFSRALSDGEIATLSRNPWQLFKPTERRFLSSGGAGGGSASQTVAFTLDGISAAVAQVAGRTQSLSASLDGVTFSASQVAGHSQTLAATLDGVSFSAAQSVGGANSQSLAVTLDGVQFAASQTLGHAQSANVALDGVTFAASQTLRHSQSFAAVLDDLTFSSTQSASSPVKSQSLAVTLDDLQFSATQEGPAVAQGHGFLLVDFEPRLWWKRKPKVLDEQEAAEKIASVARQIERVAVKQVKSGRVVQPVVSKPAKAEILQAIAPQLQQMPGFDPVELYRAILERLIQQEQQRQAEQQAQQIAAQEIERIRLMELDEDETIILLMGA